MGYYTEYSLRVLDYPNYVSYNVKDLINPQEAFVKFMKSKIVNYSSPFNEGIKWPDHKEEMCEFSKILPEVVYVLEGKGEDDDDLWREYYRNGKMYKEMAKITYEPFSANKLQ